MSCLALPGEFCLFNPLLLSSLSVKIDIFCLYFAAWLPLSQSHRGNVFKHVDGGAVVEQQEDPQEARGGRGGEERPGRH